MPKIFLALAAFFLISASTIVMAKSENSGSSSHGEQSKPERTEVTAESHGGQGTELKTTSKVENEDENDNESDENSEASSSSKPSATCDPTLNFKNHGEFVKCVAKLHEGGEEVKEAAHSDTGKRKSSTPSASLNPQATSSATASASPEEEATGSSALKDTQRIVKDEVKGLVIALGNLLEKLQSLFHF